MRIPRLALLPLLLLGCAKKAPAPKVPPSLAFEIRKGDAVSHILGTCHLPLELADRVDQALIDQARLLFVEVAREEFDPTKVLKSVWSEERSVSADLDRESFAVASRQLKTSLPASMMEHLEVWVTQTALGLDKFIPPDHEMGSMDQALDGQVMVRAEAAGVPIQPLETLEDQFALLRSQPMDLAADLRPNEEQLAERTRVAQAVIDLCTTNDLSLLPADLVADTPDNRLLLSDRNERWLTPLVPELEQGGAFIAVGALHLAGSKGLLTLLADQGFTTTMLPRPVPPTQPQAYVPTPWVAPTMISAENRQTIASAGAEAMCTDGEVARTCFEPEQDRCQQQATLDISLCLDQHFSTANEVQAGAQQPPFLGCIMSGWIGRAMAEGFPDRPGCAALKQQIEGASAP